MLQGGLVRSSRESDLVAPLCPTFLYQENGSFLVLLFAEEAVGWLLDRPQAEEVALPSELVHKILPPQL